MLKRVPWDADKTGLIIKSCRPTKCQVFPGGIVIYSCVSLGKTWPLLTCLLALSHFLLCLPLSFFPLLLKLMVFYTVVFFMLSYWEILQEINNILNNLTSSSRCYKNKLVMTAQYIALYFCKRIEAEKLKI